LAGLREISGYESSRTKELHDLLDQVLGAIATLSRSTAPPRYSEFDIGELAHSYVVAENPDKNVEIQVAGLRPHIVKGDATLVGLALRNGLKNAIEATSIVNKEDRKPIIVTWGETDIDYWAAIVDRASGLPRDTRHVWEIGTTTKQGHLGMGLAIAKSAVDSMGGKIELFARDDGGTRFEFRWPTPKVAKG
jgi:signal transduction histidine kinase